MITLDASVLIAFLSQDDVHHDAAKAILETDDRLLAHTITVAEVLVAPAAAGRLEQARRQLSAVLLNEVDRIEGEAAKLARLRAETRLKLPDCCVLLAAESSTSPLATFDRRLAEVARTRGVTVVDQVVR